MNIHYLKHVPFEGLGSIDQWARVPGHKLSATKFYEDYKMPFVDICDLLIVMGGNMSVGDEALYPWLKEEKKFIEKALHKGKKVIGICLGAQLLAEVLGAKVYPNKEKEIGWYPVTLTDQAKNSGLFASFPDNPVVLHWHGDTFDLPKGAQHLAYNEACTNQAFLYKQQALGLQFHMEMTSGALEVMIQHCGHELSEGKYIQKQNELMKDDFFEPNRKMMESLLNRFTTQ